MILPFAMALTVDGSELDTLVTAVEACERTTVARTIDAEGKRHAAFLLDAFREQRDIAATRADIAARRRTFRSAPQPTRAVAEGEAALGLAAQAAADRQQSLDDQRRLDGLQQEAVNNLRQLYLSKCQGKGA